MNRFFPTVAWITVFGDMYTYSQSADEFKCTTRVCFENFNRIDFVITTQEKLAKVNDWPMVPFFSGTKIYAGFADGRGAGSHGASFPPALVSAAPF